MTGGQRTAPWVWADYWSVKQADIEPALRAHLKAAGLELHANEGYHACGILFVSDAALSRIADIRALCDESEGRLLVAWCGPDGRSEMAWSLLDAGACDVMPAGNGNTNLPAIVQRLKRWVEVERIVRSPEVQTNLAGRSRCWVAAMRQVVDVASFSSLSVLLTGENGTGKELVARLIHTLDRRPDKKDLVTVDCTTVVPELSGSEFFGHERGAFTSAINSREGAFELADKGSVFLDEVGELPLQLQADLLRVVQEGTFKRVGSNGWRRTQFRLICATHRDLAEEEQHGAFRRDFYHRIANARIQLPALRDRREDIPLLVERFLCESLRCTRAPSIERPVLDHLMLRNYPGNVRELRLLAMRMAAVYPGSGPITPGMLPAEELRLAIKRSGEDWRNGEFHAAIRAALAAGASLREISAGAADAAIQIALQESGGSLKRAAGRLGVTDRALQMRRASVRPAISPVQ